MKYLFFLLFIMCSCIPESQLKPILYLEHIHDNYSKVWVVKKELDKNNKTVNFRREEQNTFTFFKDGTLFIQPRLHLGGQLGSKAKYYFKVNKKTADTLLKIIVNKKIYKFDVQKMRKHKLTLKPVNKNNSFNQMELMPLDKPF